MFAFKNVEREKKKRKTHHHHHSIMWHTAVVFGTPLNIIVCVVQKVHMNPPKTPIPFSILFYHHRRRDECNAMEVNTMRICVYSSSGMAWHGSKIELQKKRKSQNYLPLIFFLSFIPYV